MRPTSSRSGGRSRRSTTGPAVRGTQSRAVLPALRDGAVLARGRTGIQDVVDPSVYVRLPMHTPRRRSRCMAGDKLLIWTTTPWTCRATWRSPPGQRSNTCGLDAGGEVRSCSPRRWCERCSARTRRSSIASAVERSSEGNPRRNPGAVATYEGPIFEHRSTSGRLCRSSPATSSQPRTEPGLVHIAPAFGEDDFRRGGRCRVPFDPDDPPHSLQPGAARTERMTSACAA